MKWLQTCKFLFAFENIISSVDNNMNETVYRKCIGKISHKDINENKVTMKARQGKGVGNNCSSCCAKFL